MVELGDKAKDTVSGFTGIVVGIHDWLNGCTRVTLQPKVDKEGALLESQCFDEPQLKVIKKKTVPKGSRDTGGPAPYKTKRSNKI